MLQMLVMEVMRGDFQTLIIFQQIIQMLLVKGNIFSPVHDINPASSEGEEIRWEIIGEYPNRVLAVSFYNVEMYSCGDLLATHMIVV